MATHDTRTTTTRRDTAPDYGKIAAAAGLLTALLVLISIIITFSNGAPPALDDGSQKIIDYYQNNQGRSEIGAIVGFLILGTASTWFLGLYTSLRDRGNASSATDALTDNAWPRLALATFIASGAIVAAQGSAALALALGAQDEFDGAPGVAGALFNLYNALGSAFAIPFAVFLAATAYSLDRVDGRRYPSWLKPALLIGALCSFIAFFAPFAEIDALAYFGLIPYLVFGLVAAVTGKELGDKNRVTTTRH